MIKLKSEFFCLNEPLKYDSIIKSQIPGTLIQNSFGYKLLNSFPSLNNLNNGQILLFTNHQLLSSFISSFDISRILMPSKKNIAQDFLCCLSLKLYNSADYKKYISDYVDLQEKIETSCLNKLYKDFDVFQTNQDNITCMKLMTAIFKQAPERFISSKQTQTQTQTQTNQIPIYSGDSIVFYCSIEYQNIYHKTYKIVYSLV